VKAYEYIIKIRTKAAEGSLSRLKLAAGKAEGGADKLRDSVRRNSDEMGRAASKSKSLSASFGGLQRTVMNLVGAYAGFQTITSIAKLGMDMEQTRVSFKTMLGSAEEANATIANLNEFSNVTPFTNDQVIRAGKSLTAFKVQGDQLLPTLRNIGDIAAGTGKDFNELTTIYGKAKIAGTLYAEDINQLIEAGIPVMGEFAKIMGVQESQVKKLASEGKLSFDILEQAFRNMTSEGGMYYNLMAQQAETAGGKLSTLVGKAQLLGVRIGEAFNPALSALFDMGIALLDNEKALTSIITVVAAVAGVYGIYKTQAFLAGLETKWFAKTLKAQSIQARIASFATKGFSLSLKGVGTAIRSIPILGWIVMAIEGLVLLYQHSEQFRAIIWGVWEATKAAFNGFNEWITGMWQGIKLIATGIWEIWSGVYAGLLKLLGKAWDYLQGLGQKLGGFFSELWTGIVGGIDKARDYLKEKVTSLIESVKTFFKPLTDWLGNLFSPLVDSFKGIFNSIKSMITNFLSGSGGWIADKLGIDVEKILSGLNKVKLGTEIASNSTSEYGKKIGDAAGEGYKASLNKSQLERAVEGAGGGSNINHRDPENPFPSPDNDKAKEGIDNITGGGSKQTNITLNVAKLVESLTISTTNLSEGADEIQDKVNEALLRAISGLSYAGNQ
jgi:tape measure domain-containing protein